MGFGDRADLGREKNLQVMIQITSLNRSHDALIQENKSRTTHMFIARIQWGNPGARAVYLSETALIISVTSIYKLNLHSKLKENL